MTERDSNLVQSTLGRLELDKQGSAVSVVRMDPANTFISISELLRDYINRADAEIWQEIRRRIDRIYEATSLALEIYDAAEPFSQEVKRQIQAGKRLLFKPNWVAMPLIDYKTHGVGARGADTQWEHQAVVMRWFHDKLGISYNQMNVGESGPETNAASLYASRLTGEKITKQAILEAKYGDSYGGWGFYFTRKYLADCHAPDHTDNPMNGYAESLQGHCIPPGQAGNRLLLYDTDYVDEINGRTVPVKNGINFKELTLHKLYIGGDPSDAEDRQNWPGCVMVNLSKLKVHMSEQFTNAIKNLGMGFYSMQTRATDNEGEHIWKYSAPNLKDPTYKLNVPHTVWVLKMDPDTLKPVFDKDGNYIWTRTGGMKGTMADAIQAVVGQGVMMLHVTDAIEMTNIHHCGPEGVPIPEGLIFVSADPVALDTCATRYMFSMVPMEETAGVMQKYKLPADVIQKVPQPVIQGQDVVNAPEPCYDSSFSRYQALQYSEERGLGRQLFYVVGRDIWEGGRLASLQQHLGKVQDGVFTQLMTKTMYNAPRKPLMDLQTMIFNYLEAEDKLTGSSYKKMFMEIFDENQDGVIDYCENGRGSSPALMALGVNLLHQKIDPLQLIKLRFLIAILQNRLARREWNDEGHHVGDSFMLSQSLAVAFNMSQLPVEKEDPAYPGRKYGKGKWPSLKGILDKNHYGRAYGTGFPHKIDASGSPYGLLFQYADIKYNNSTYYSPQSIKRREDLIEKYFEDLENGAAQLPFTFYVPQGFGLRFGKPIPNVVENDDPALVFTAVMNGEKWKDFKLSEYHLE